MLPTRLIALGIIAELRRIETQLLGDKGAERGRWLLALLKYPAWET